MSSASRSASRPMWLRIAWGYWLSFGALYLLTGALVLFAVLRHHVMGYHETLALLSADLVADYRECGGDIGQMKRDFRETVEEEGHGNVFLTISDADGRALLKESSNDAVTRAMLARASRPGTTYRITAAKRGGAGGEIAVRVCKTPLPDGRILSVGDNVTRDERHAHSVATLLSVTLLLIVLAGGVVGVALARRFTGPLSRMAKAARAVVKGDYSVRVSESSEGREIADLENAFNTMCATNEKTLAELRVLTDDIAHDMRTPLTRMRAAAEMRVMGGSTDETLAETVSEETGSMLEMINMMLEISRTDCGISRTPREDLDLATFVRRICDLYSALAEDKGLRFVVECPPGPVIFSGHKGRLQQLLGNLLDNAVKFTPRGGEVSVRLSSDPAAIEVANTGPGIAACDLPHVFTRFWRADSSRSLPGNGLGLALVKAIAASYGGSVACTSDPGRETVFCVELPKTAT